MNSVASWDVLSSDIRFLAIDCRMLFASGIGRYLREILKRSPLEVTGFLVYCNSKQQIAWLLENLPNARPVFSDDKIYGLREQILRAWHLRDCKVLWSPHYNFLIESHLRQIVTIHDLAHIALPQFFGYGLRRVYAQWLLAAVRDKAAKIIFISEFSRHEFSRYLGKTKAGMITVPNGIDPMWFGQICSERENFYLYVGNVKPHKNLKKLAEALKILSTEIPRRLIIVGKRDGFITGLSDNLDFGNSQVEFTGEISDEYLTKLYRKAKALIFPSLYEGFGLPVLEAMAGGCPVLVSRAASMPEVCGLPYVNSGEGNVLYFDPEDCDSIAEQILTFERLSYNDIKSMTINAKRHAETYSWDKTAAMTWAVILGELREGEKQCVV